MAEESKLHKDIRADVLRRGGTLRKCAWVNRRGAPDDLIWVPGCRHFWAELKAPGEDLDPHQAREHKRMREEGHVVVVLRTVQDYLNVLDWGRL